MRDAREQGTPAPAVIVERWSGLDGWPTHRVYYLGAPFGEAGDRFVEVSDHDEAVEAAKILAACSGWPIEYRRSD